MGAPLTTLVATGVPAVTQQELAKASGHHATFVRKLARERSTMATGARPRSWPTFNG